MILDSKTIGGILLIAGTSIGGGMLGLPIVTAKAGFLNSTLLFLFCWILMTFTALLTLEVSLCFPKNSNMFSMVRATLSKSKSSITWVLYLLFLYSLVCAYIAGGRDLVSGVFKTIGIEVPIVLCSILFVLLFGFVVLSGVKLVDLFNRSIMLIKLSLIFLVIFFIVPHINYDFYAHSDLEFILPTVSIVITSFGFSIIVPSLREYFNDDVKKIRKVIILGSLIPLLCYFAWNAVILGTIPLNSEYGLGTLIGSPEPVLGLLEGIRHHAESAQAITLSKIFISISILTSFVCVALALSDYLFDVFKERKRLSNRSFISLATFVPPLFIVSFYPKAFILFLSLAGLFCIILQCFMPALMAWNCRYVKNIATPYRVWGSKASLLTSMFISIILLFLVSYEIIK